MSTSPGTSSQANDPATLARSVLRGVGQVFFQENALSGACFVLGIACGSPVMALGAVVGSAIGLATARVLKFDEDEAAAGIFGFNAALVGIATLFFFRPGFVSLLLLGAGCVGATWLTRGMRQRVPFPTYTSPFIVTAWVVYFLGRGLGATHVDPGDPTDGVGFAQAVAHGVSQVMFQASVWTAALFVAGIALNNARHAGWVLLGSLVGTLAAAYHATPASSAVHIERLLDHVHSENIALGLYGYNATLAAVALVLSRRSLFPPLLGMLLTVPITEYIPLLGLPALTAPFVLATWLVLLLGKLDEMLLQRADESDA